MIKGKEFHHIFDSAARTATSSKTMACTSTQGLFFINVTSITASPSVVFSIQGVSPIGDIAYDILTSAAITATGLTVLRVSPHLTAAANSVAKDMLPAALKITDTHADADSITYSVSYLGSEA